MKFDLSPMHPVMAASPNTKAAYDVDKRRISTLAAWLLQLAHQFVYSRVQVLHVAARQKMGRASMIIFVLWTLSQFVWNLAGAGTGLLPRDDEG